PLALERKLDIVIEVLQGLSYAHERGVIHRDVKPSNVRIASDGSVKIMDFGIARLQSADVTGSGAIVGTPTYMAPEQITNGDTTERLSLRWTPIPSAVLRLVTHAPIKWRAAALTALMVTALVLLYVSRSPSPVAAPPDAELTSATLDQLLTYPVPVHLNAALVAQRDSALAARERARRAGAMKNNGSSLILAETVVQNAERALRTGDLARASSGYWSALP